MLGNITCGQEIGSPFEWCFRECQTLTTTFITNQQIKPATSVHHFITSVTITSDVMN